MNTLIPSISWYVNEDSVMTPYEEYYAGSYPPGSIMNFEVQVWNNRLGTVDVADAVNPSIVFFFDTIENTTLLNYCSILVDGVAATITIDLDKVVIPLNKTLSGKMSQTLSTDNYSDINISIGPLPNGLRNEIKNLFIDIQYDL